MDDNIWQLIAVALLSSAGSAGVSWLSYGMSRVSKKEMQEYMAKELITMHAQISNKILEHENQLSDRITRIETKIDHIIKSLESRLNRFESSRVTHYEEPD